MVVDRVLDTYEPENGHGQLGGLVDKDQKLIVDHPAGAGVSRGEEGEGHSVKAEEVVNKTSNRIENPTYSLNADELVDKSIPLSSPVPHPEQVDVHGHIEHGLQQEHGEQGIDAYQTRYATHVVLFSYSIQRVLLI